MLLVSEMFARLLKWMLRDMETQRWIFVHILTDWLTIFDISERVYSILLPVKLRLLFL